MGTEAQGRLGMEVCTEGFDVGRNFGNTTKVQTKNLSVARQTGKATEQGIHFLTVGLIGGYNVPP